MQTKAMTSRSDSFQIRRCASRSLTRTLTLAGASLLASSLLFGAGAAAQTGEESDRYEPPWLVTAGAGVHLNNLYGGAAATLRYRDTYGRRADSLLFDNLYWEVGGGLTSSILVSFLRAHIEWSPIAILKLRATYQGRFTLGIPTGTGAGLPFATATEPYGDAILEARRDQTVASYGHQLFLEPTLQAKLWRIIVLNRFKLGLHYFHGGPDYLYQNESDHLIRRGSLDWTIHEQPILLFDIHRGPGFNKLYGGAYYELNYAGQAAIVRHRVGLMALYSPVRTHGVLYEPTLIIQGGVNLVDRNRAGTPYILFLLQSGFVVGGAGQ